MNQGTRRLTNGLQISLRQLLKLDRDWQSYEPEQEAILRTFISAIPADGCFVNIGASIGFYPMLAKRWAPGLTVQAYEPLEMHREFFRENMQLNGCAPGEIELFSEGVSRADGHVDYLANGFGSTIISKREATMKQKLKQIRLKLRRWLMEQGIKKYPLEFTRISVVSLHTVVERAGGSIDLLLTDVQGSEGDILQGGEDLIRAGSIKNLLINTHGASMHDTCQHLLEQYGYQVLHSDRQGRHDGLLAASHPTCTNIFTHWSAARSARVPA
jgi:FkbM family methyltransferase